MNYRLAVDIATQFAADAASFSRFSSTPLGPVLHMRVPGPRAVDAWLTLRRHANETGFLPTVSALPSSLGLNVEDVQGLVAYLESDAVPRVIAAADLVNPLQWLEARLAEGIASLEEEGDDLDALRAELEGKWPDDIEPRQGFTLTADTLVELHLLPTTVPWHVPAFYRYGGTGTPDPQVHVALLRYWNGIYGAEMLGYRGDLIECRVDRPPERPADALTLAWQYYAYCPDIVIQGMATIASLAATLLRGTAWYFWWD